MPIEMKVAGIMLDPMTQVPIVILRDLQDKDTLPIWIGLVEASAIAMEMEKIKIHRPLTHDLLKNVLEQLKVLVIKIEITDLRDNTFYALIHLDQGGNLLTIDSRPSDAIALALRTDSPIFVHEKVIEKSKKLDIKDLSFSAENKDKWAEILENLNPEDFGKYKM
jgi:bifunctional DNase/RNase